MPPADMEGGTAAPAASQPQVPPLSGRGGETDGAAGPAAAPERAALRSETDAPAASQPQVPPVAGEPPAAAGATGETAGLAATTNRRPPAAAAGPVPSPSDLPPPPQPVPPDPAAPVPLPAVATLLGLSPFNLRALLDEFDDLVPVVRRDPGPVIEPEALARLRVLAAAQAAGLSSDAMRQRVERGPASPEVAAGQLAGRMEMLQAALAQSERRRVEDRDRLMLALIRTQQEIQQLRVELAGPRRSRRKGFFARLFHR